MGRKPIYPRICIVEGCEEKSRDRGMCPSHGYFWRKENNIEKVRNPKCCKRCKIPTRNKDGYCSLICRDYDKLPMCKTCGKVIFSFSESRAYCSQKCSNERERVKVPKEPQGVCEQCGKDFVRNKSRNGNRDSLRFCSRECSFDFFRRKEPESCKVYFPECKQCGVLFTARQYKSIVCSKKCDGKYRYRINPDYYKSMSKNSYKKCGFEKQRERNGVTEKTYTCIVCQEHFLSFNPLKKCCSSKCSKKHTKEIHKADKKARDKRLNGRCVDKNITLKRLHKKDGGMCGICGKKVDMRRKHPHPMSGSIDHILPIALGGWHEWTNVQLAHLSCNSRKGATMPRQRRIGLFESVRI